MDKAQLMEMIAATKDDVSGGGPSGELVTLALELEDLRVEIDGVEETLNGMKTQQRHLEKFAIPEAMIGCKMVGPDGKAKFSMESGATCHLKTSIFATVRAADIQAFFGWLREKGHGHLIKETVNNNTLRAWAKEMMEQGEEIPHEVLTVTSETSATLLKRRKGDGQK